MKKLFLLLGMLLSFPLAVFSQTDQTPERGRAEAALRSPNSARSVSAGHRRDRIADLGLSDAKAAVVRSELQQFLLEMRSIGTNGALSATQRQNSKKAIAHAFGLRLRELLTEEQFALLRQPPRPSTTPRVAQGVVELPEDAVARRGRWDPNTATNISTSAAEPQ